MAKEHVYPWEGSCRLLVDSGAGILLVRGWSNDEVKIIDNSGSAEVSHSGSKVYLEGSSIDVSVYLPMTSDILVDGTALDVDLGGLDGRGQLDLTTGSVRIENWRGDLEIDTTTGNITINDLKGNCEIDSGDGGVSLSGCQGTVNIDTGNGSVELNDCQGTLTVDTGGGSVRLWSFKGPVTIDTGGGDVKLVDVSSRNVVVDTGGGGISANLPGGNPGRWTLDTGRGNIDLAIPVDSSLRLELRSQGSIHAEELPLTEVQRRGEGLSGQLGDGRGRLDVNSHSGIITAKAAPAAGFNQETDNQGADEESLRILAMLEQGTITIDEAEKLLDALRGIREEEVGEEDSHE